MQESLASHEAARLVGEAPVSGGVRVIVRAIDGWDAAGLKSIAASAVSGEAAIAALFSTTRPAVSVIAKSRDVRADCNAVLKDLVRQFGGRGGGKPDLAQGGGLDAEAEHLIAAARASIQQQLSQP
jgi:alanyl-tRNA synthetase